MKIVLIDTSIPINTRNDKYIESLREFFPESEIKVITWKRDDFQMDIPDYYYLYESPAEYGNPWQKLIKLFGFAKYARRVLRQYKPDVIIASHWESLLVTPSNVEGNPLIIYENLDVPTGGKIVRGLTRYFEMRKLKHVDLIVHASRFFKELYPETIPQIVLENKSKFSFEAMPLEEHKNTVVSYIGTVRYRDILSNFISAASKVSNVDVNIFGDGQDLNSLREEYGRLPNVKFTGTYPFSDIPKLYSKSDVVWAAYPNKDFNVIYAISNKFHESMMCGVPCIYADKTKLGDYVKERGIGFTVDPYSKDDICGLISKIANKEIDLTLYRERLKEQVKSFTTWDEDFAQVAEFIKSKKEQI